MFTIKKHIALLLAAVLVALSASPVNLIAAADDPIEIWDGDFISSRNEFAGGNGSENNPYIIENGAQLAYAIDMGEDAGGHGIGGDGGQYFKLANDIYLNDVSDPKWYENEDNNAWLNADGQWGWHFNGHLDGDGHIVYGIWYPETAQTNEDAKCYASGLIPRMRGGSVKNIGVRYSRIYGLLYAGGIVGQTNGVLMRTIDQCFVDETVYVKYTALPGTGAPENGNGAAAGILGVPAGGNNTAWTAISNCYSKAILSGANANRINGIIGTAYNNYWTIENCYSVGFVPYYGKNNYDFSALSGAAEIFQNIYTDNRAPISPYELYTYVDTALMKGEAAKNSMSGLNYDKIFETVENNTPKLQVFGDLNTDLPEVTPPDDDNYGPIEVWDGSAITNPNQFAGGTGSEDDPYIIENGAQLVYAIDLGGDVGGRGIGGGSGKYFKLANDIYLNDVTKPNWYENEDNNVWVNATGRWNWGFQGYLDGDGHCVYGIWYPANNTQSEGTNDLYAGAGLIPAMVFGSVKNIGVRYSYISAKRGAGAILGTPVGTKPKEIDSCFADETVSVSFTSVIGGAGGIVGYYGEANSGSACLTISNCYSKADLSCGTGNPHRTNGIIGNSLGAGWIIKNCYSVGHTPYFASRGQEFSNVPGATQLCKNIYSDIAPRFTDFEVFTYVDTASMQGEAARTAMPELDFDNVFETVKNNTPKLRVFKDMNTNLPDVNVSGEDETPDWVWDGTVASSFAGGNGTEANPYIIENGAQLARAIDVGINAGGQGIGGGGGQYFRLANNIYLNDVSKPGWYNNANNNAWLNADGQWTWGFNGHLDGDGYCVYGIWYPANNPQSANTSLTYAAAGLVPVMQGGSLKNIGIRNAQIYGKAYAGALVGTAIGTATKVIDSCFAEKTVRVKFTDSEVSGGASGIVGYFANDYSYSVSLAISNCYSKASLACGTVDSINRTNGILGTAWQSGWSIQNCYSIGYKPYYASSVDEFTNAAGGTALIKNNYTVMTPTNPTYEIYTHVDSAWMQGVNAKNSMSGLDFSEVYYWTIEGYPNLRVFGVRNHDITGDGVSNAKDLVVLRKHLIGSEECGFADINGDSAEDIRDLICLKKIIMTSNEVEGEPDTDNKYIDTDGDFSYNVVDWDGPAGYVIVIPTGNLEAQKAAQRLQQFFIKQSNIALGIVNDTIAATAKEILIGKTNRVESDKSMTEAQLAVTVKDGKLVFDGGHDAVVRAAVDKFIRLMPKRGQAVTFSLTTDFKSTLPGGYVYIWGDEFEGDDIDFSKWAFDDSMIGDATLKTTDDKDVANCENGRLVLRAYKCEDPAFEGAEFKTSRCLSTGFNMHYTYGYAEIRARVPALPGAFPAWWTKTANLNWYPEFAGDVRNKDYHAEVDIFESFNSEIRCTLHKWYREFDFTSVGGSASQHSDLSSWLYKGFVGDEYDLTYKADNHEFFTNQYHVYGYEWTPEYVAMSIDGKVYGKIDITESYDQHKEGLFKGADGFHDTAFLIFDNWIQYGTSVTGQSIYDSLNELPTCFAVDYVRLYQRTDLAAVNRFSTRDAVNTFPTRK